MCDLWRNTLPHSVAPRAIPSQIEHALARLKPATTLKLYNSGSFFDPAAIPLEDYQRIGQLCSGFRRVVVECHPRLVGERIESFQQYFSGTLEVAIGLETVHPEALDKLNKRITITDFYDATVFLKSRGIRLRVFLLVNPPFIPQEEQKEWLRKSVAFALKSGADIISLIPVRGGNGALDRLREAGQFREPSLRELEESFEIALQYRPALILADTWDLERFSRCPACLPSRRTRLERMNLAQRIEPRANCAACGS